MRGVKDLSDIPLLFAEGEIDMGAPKKTRAELLDKVIQFIWDYQEKHNGETPQQTVIERHVGIKGSGGFYYIALLVEEGRLNKISSRPFRVTITSHPKNASAINRFKRLRQKQEEHDEQERQRIREEQERNATAEQMQNDKAAVFAAASETMVAENENAPAEKPAIPLNQEKTESRAWDRQLSSLVQSADRYVTASDQYRAAQRALKSEMPRLIKFADERDLVFELVGRGYTVSKNR